MPLTAIDSPTYDTLLDVSAMPACSSSYRRGNRAFFERIHRDIDPIISSIASQDSIDIDNHFHGTIPSGVRLFPFLLRSILLSIFRRSFRCWGEVSLDFDRIVNRT